jgi:ribosomal protein L28
MLKIWSKNIEVTQSCIKNIDSAGGVDELLLATVYSIEEYYYLYRI